MSDWKCGYRPRSYSADVSAAAVEPWPANVIPIEFVRKEGEKRRGRGGVGGVKY